VRTPILPAVSLAALFLLSSCSASSKMAPGAPTAVVATPANASAHVAFRAPATNGGSVITRYIVTSSPGGFTATGKRSPISVAGLANGTSYTFTVKTRSGVGTSAASVASSAVTPRSVAGAPTGVTATPGNVSVSVAFRAPATNGGSALTGYTATSSPGGLTVTGAGSPISVAGLANGTSYTFTVTASNAVGTSAASAPSSAVALTPTRVLVTGDSVAMRLTLGLQDAAAKNSLEIISAVAVTCGLDGQRRLVDSSGEWAQFAQVFADNAPCVPSDQLIAHYHPALILNIDSGAWSLPAIFEGTYGAMLAKSLPPTAGTHLVWTTIACPQQGYPRPAALAQANTQMRELAAQHPSEVSVIDLAQLVCPNGTPMQGLDGVQTLRTDGLHYNVAGSDLVGGWMAAQLNQIAHE
jgi:Fibronectin type III domain